MATLEQRLRKLEQQTFKNVGTGSARVECDEEFRVVQVFFKTPSGGERLATPDELEAVQVRWDAMTNFIHERGFEGVMDFIDNEEVKAECVKAMEDALHSWRQSK